MADNTIAMQVQTPQQPQSPLQTALALQKVKQAFPNSSLANPVKPTAFETDTDNG